MIAESPLRQTCFSYHKGGSKIADDGATVSCNQDVTLLRDQVSWKPVVEDLDPYPFEVTMDNLRVQRMYMGYTAYDIENLEEVDTCLSDEAFN